MFYLEINRTNFGCDVMWCKRCSVAKSCSLSLACSLQASLSQFHDLSLSLTVLFVSLEYRYVYWFASYHHHYCGTNPMRRTCDGALLWWLNAFAVVMQDNKLSLVIGIMCNLNGYPNIHGLQSNGNDNTKSGKSESDSVMVVLLWLGFIIITSCFLFFVICLLPHPLHSFVTDTHTPSLSL